MDIIRTPKISNIKMLDKSQSLIHQSTDSTKTHNTILGTLYLTATHLIFIDKEAQQETWILHSHLSSIIKHPFLSEGVPIQIKCKNFNTNTFIIPKEKDAHDLYTSLYQISQPINLSDLYCFHYTASKEPFQFNRQFGWNKFNLIDEFRRQNVPNSNWSLTKLNHDYSLCDTYPKLLFVPKTVTNQILLASAKFRSKGRLPVLSYYYNKNSATICRCSQPLAGLSQRCVEDEQLLQSILNANISKQKEAKLLYVVDTRPKINAIANRAAGKGYENSYFYENIKFHFFGIENIHVMRGSLQKLIEACEIKVPVTNNFINGIANSGWLKHIKSVLETAYFIAKTVESGISVVVHCSDGWDRTSQTSALAGLILDPFYRTLDGFQCLIEKEWLNFGHKFTDRCGHIQIGDSKEIAPVFTQFIDAVWQITQQFPTEFEFNENYLLNIHDHVYSCQFGTFIGNCEKEREDIDVRNTTYSLWAKLDSQREQFINPLYYLSKEPKLEFLQVQLLPQLIRYWRSMYNRFDFGIHPRESLDDLLAVTYNHTKSLEGHLNFLKDNIKKLKELKNQNKLNLINNDLIDSKNNQLSKQNSLQNSAENQSIKSFDSINSPLEIVEKCMQRLQMKYNQSTNQSLSSNSSSNNLSNLSSNNANESTNNLSINLLAKQSNENDNNLEEEYKNLIELSNSINSIALDWQTSRSIRKCVCGGTYEQTNNRFSNCWCCGLLLCCRCLEKRIKLPGLLFSKNVEQNIDQSAKDNQIKEDELLNNEKNEKLTKQLKYKIHPLEQLDQKLTKQLIEPIIEQNKTKLKTYKHHPLEILDNNDQDDDDDIDECFEPIELGIEYEEKDSDNSLINTIDNNNLVNSINRDDESSLYELVPVCTNCEKLLKCGNRSTSF